MKFGMKWGKMVAGEVGRSQAEEEWRLRRKGGSQQGQGRGGELSEEG